MDSLPDEPASLISTVRRHGYALVGVFVVCGALGLAVAALRSETYTATAYLALDDPRQGEGASSVEDFERFTRTEITRARSAEVTQVVAAAFGVGPNDFTEPADVAYVSPGLFSITASASSADLAADRANVVVSAYRDNRVAEAEAISAVELRVLQTNLDEERTRFALLEAELAAAAAAAAAEQDPELATEPTDIGSAGARARLDAVLVNIGSIEAQLRDVELRAARSGSGGIDFVDPAQPPSSASGLSALRFGLAGGFLGMVGAVVVVWLVAARRGDPANHAVIARTLEAPVFADVPPGPPGATAMADAVETPLPAFDLILAALQVRRRSVLTVTGLSPETDAAAVAVQLGSAAAHRGLDTVVVDGDRTGHQVTTWLARDGRPGLLDALGVDRHDAAAVVPAGDAGLSLSILPIGDVTSAHEMSQARIEALVKDLRARHDLVIIAGPPLLGSADALTLCAASADGVVLVTPDGPRLTELRRARDRLAVAEASLVGAVLTNGVAPSPAPALAPPAAVGNNMGKVVPNWWTARRTAAAEAKAEHAAGFYRGAGPVMAEDPGAEPGGAEQPASVPDALVGADDDERPPPGTNATSTLTARAAWTGSEDPARSRWSSSNGH